MDPALTTTGTLFYLDGTRHIVAVTLKSNGPLAVASQRTLDVMLPANRGWDVDPTGTRFVYETEPMDGRPRRLTITVNALADTAETSSPRTGLP